MSCFTTSSLVSAERGGTFHRVLPRETQIATDDAFASVVKHEVSTVCHPKISPYKTSFTDRGLLQKHIGIEWRYRKCRKTRGFYGLPSERITM